MLQTNGTKNQMACSHVNSTKLNKLKKNEYYKCFYLHID